MRSSENEVGQGTAEAALKVLIADDDPPTRILLRAAITQWGYSVVEAANGEEAWDLLQLPDPPRLLIVDWLMPKLDGIGLCARIKQEKSLHVYTILLTQVTGTTNIIKGLEAGADEFLSKPFNMAELRSRLSVGARIVRFENARAFYKTKLDTIQIAINNDDSLAVKTALNEFIEQELISRFGGECRIDQEGNELQLHLKLPLVKK